MAYGLPLKADGDEKCLSMLHAVEETLSRQLKACKAPLSKRQCIEGSYPAFMCLEKFQHVYLKKFKYGLMLASFMP